MRYWFVRSTCLITDDGAGTPVSLNCYLACDLVNLPHAMRCECAARSPRFKLLDFEAQEITYREFRGEYLNWLETT
jgi:hypothetical protein